MQVFGRVKAAPTASHRLVLGRRATRGSTSNLPADTLAACDILRIQFDYVHLKRKTEWDNELLLRSESDRKLGNLNYAGLPGGGLGAFCILLIFENVEIYIMAPSTPRGSFPSRLSVFFDDAFTS